MTSDDSPSDADLDRSEHSFEDLTARLLGEGADLDEPEAGDASASPAAPDAPIEMTADLRESPYPVITSYKAAARRIELLTREDEQRLGHEVLDARERLARGLALVPHAAITLLEAVDETEGDERPLTDVIQNAFGPAAKRAGKGGWRGNVARLRAACDAWRAAADGRARHAARVKIARAFVAAEPAIPVLREALGRLRGLAARDEDGAGVRPAVLRAVVRRAAAEEARYARASRELVEANFRLVFFMANKLVGNGVSLEDLVQDGILGLMRAVDKFDHRLGYKFSTYACGWIWQGVTRSVADSSRTVRVAAHMHDLIIKLNRLSASLWQRHGRRPTASELADASDLPEWKVRTAMRAALRPLSLEAPLSNNEDADLKSLVVDETQAHADDAVHDTEMGRLVGGLLDVLPEREAVIVKLRHGIGVPEPLTLEQIGRVMGITRERTRQLEARAMERLRECADPSIALAIAS